MFKIVAFSFLLFVFLSACSEEQGAVNKNGTVWKEQIDTLDKAKQVEGIIMDSAEHTRDMIEQSE